MRHQNRLRPSGSARLRRGLASAAALVLSAGLLTVGAPTAHAATPVTPGSFTGYGFDQCETPTQATMDAWWQHSPFAAVGVYVSGDSRACPVQKNLTPTWVKAQQSRGWKVLPIIVGPQSSCHPAFPRHEGDAVIDPAPGADGTYAAARTQGRAEAERSVADSKRLGISRSSILWYDLEGFDVSDVNCRESALHFVSAWNQRVAQLGYTTGLYGSAGSSLQIFDLARLFRPGKFTLPSYVWIARWDGVANTSASPLMYDDGWLPGRRMKQFRGDHDETHGGVTIEIDSNWLDLGKGSRASTNRRCGVKGLTSQTRYVSLSKKHARQKLARTKSLQCLLREHGYRSVKVTGKYDAKTRKAVRKYRKAQGLSVSSTVTRTTWIRLLSKGSTPVLKVGSTGTSVHRLQQSLSAAGVLKKKSTGLYDAKTSRAVRAYQKKVKLPATGVVSTATWQKLRAGKA